MLLVLFSFVSIKLSAQIDTDMIEDWESGTLTQFEWQTGGTAEWQITDQTVYEGVYSAQSGLITDNQESWILLEYEVYSPQDISFYYKVSSESGYDYLRFYIDNVEQGAWAGEVDWTQATYPVTAGFHSFKWAYEKDVSVSSGLDAGFIDYIVFPPMELEAAFIVDTTVICKNDVIQFQDQSIGPITEWYWIFEGATPGTSTSQNPVVAYPVVGEWDVYLQVSDGVETSEIFMPAFITVSMTPEITPTPVGLTLLCASWGNSTYSTSGLPGITEYEWAIDPVEAGNISGSGTNITVEWEENFLGTADLSVASINYCGAGVFSIPLTITRYMPEVSVVLPAFVALSTPPFELTGGSPVGGDYSGTGVSNNVFDPADAGLGTHVITYTYTDNNFCTNTAIDSITVTQFTGLTDKFGDREVSVYPNPNNGNFKIEFNTSIDKIVDLRLFNSLNALVYQEQGIQTSSHMVKEIGLNHLPKGIYYLRISGSDSEIVSKIVIQ